MYGDRAMLALYHNVHGLRHNTGIGNVEPYASTQLANTLAGMADRRRAMNLPPIVLNRRPQTPHNVAFVPLERY